MAMSIKIQFIFFMTFAHNFFFLNIMNNIVGFIIVLGLFLIIDLPVILYLNKSMYQTQFMRINKQEIGSGAHIWLAGGFAYLLLAFGIYYFIVQPELDNQMINYWNILIKGMVLGLVVYGVYNGTNMATINEWGAKEFFVDTIWGTLLSGIISMTSIFLLKRFN